MLIAFLGEFKFLFSEKMDEDTLYFSDEGSLYFSNEGTFKLFMYIYTKLFASVFSLASVLAFWSPGSSVV